ncbi:MAG: GyrI-like domain-containing protein [Chitinophagaceae bacterium]
MNKKMIVRMVALATFILLLVILGRMTTSVERMIRVNADYYDVSLQLSNIENYKSWYTGFSDGTVGTGDSAGRPVLKSVTGRELIVKTETPSQVMVTEKDGSVSTSQTISAIPLSNQKQTEVIWSARMPWYKRIYHFFTGRDPLQEGLLNIKATMEDPSLRYGFQIEVSPVRDTIILTSRQSAPDSSRNSTLQLLYDTLESYITRFRPDGAKNYYYVTSNAVSEKNKEYAVGIPVSMPSLPDEGIEYLRLPATGRVLTGKGTVGHLGELYTAMNRYANDQGLQKVAQPLEKYDIEPAMLPAHPEENVELVFPIY